MHLVRNPLHTVHSLMSVGMLTRKSPYLSFAQLQMPALNLYRSSADRALAFYLVWNKRIEDYVDIRWKVEDDPRGLLDFLGVPHEGVGLFDNRQYNHRPEYPRKRIDWDEVNPVLADAFTRITRRYGYPT